LILAILAHVGVWQAAGAILGAIQAQFRHDCPAGARCGLIINMIDFCHIGKSDGQTEGWMERRMDGQMDGLMDRWTDGQMDGWMDGWTAGRTDGLGSESTFWLFWHMLVCATVSCGGTLGAFQAQFRHD
jgi:hypothetical protein